jgi:hypothetical protein
MEGAASRHLVVQSGAKDLDIAAGLFAAPGMSMNDAR